MSESAPTTIIVGGGIIGLVSAFKLARSGQGVTLVDPAVAQGATRAAAGMLAPSAEIAPGEELNYALQRGAVAAWKQISEELALVTGRHLAVHETGTLVVGWDASDRRVVEQFVGVAKSFGAPYRSVDRAREPDVFEGLSDRIRDGIVMSDDAWLDPDEAVSLLLEALDRLGVTIVTEEVIKVGASDSGVVAITDSGDFHAMSGVFCTGSAALPEGVRTTGDHIVRPVRGVTARVQGIDRGTQPVVRAFVRGRAFYMIARPGGYCVLGATSDERAEAVVEVGELQRLLRDALDVVPALETAHVLETRVGLRPASSDLQPFFEECTPMGWAWSSGHYRHGVTLAPLAAIDAVSFCGRFS
jgi:glycine oxidase